MIRRAIKLHTSNKSALRHRAKIIGTLIAPLSLSAPLSSLLLAPASAQYFVFDTYNYSQNILTAAHTLEQINNQVKSLTNQAQSLINQAKNLANLPVSTLTQLQATIQKTQSLLAQAQNIAFDVQKINQAFSQTYGKVASNSSNSAMMAAAQTRWQTSIGAFQDSLKIQAGVVGNITGNTSTMSTLVSASQSATGALQAAQAQNQILALHSQQLSDLISVFAAKGRADALEQARTATTESQGQQQYQLFSTRTGYVASNVTMFSGN